MAHQQQPQSPHTSGQLSPTQHYSAMNSISTAEQVRRLSIRPLSSSPQNENYPEQGINAKVAAMRKAIKTLNDTYDSHKPPHGLSKEVMARELQGFDKLFGRYIREKAAKTELDWENVRSLASDQVLNYHKLPQCNDQDMQKLISKLAVLKLNGGLGTTMGCVGPKSAIEVRDGMTFLDLTVQQVEFLNYQFASDVPLILMNSFNTDDETKKIIQKYADHNVRLLTFNQSRYPRISNDSNLPVPKTASTDKYAWYPPGHGDVYEALQNSGLLAQLLEEGKEYLFISNVDNLGATVDLNILKHMTSIASEFIMELTDKTRADVKGGTLVEYEGKVRLLEIAQVPSKYVEEFKSIKKFKLFNTNNLWVSLKAIKRVVENDELDLEIIVNPKTIPETGEKSIQLETAVGAAIKHFQNGSGVNVPRSRFLPVKGTSGLFLVQSDLYKLAHGELTMNQAREFGSVPIVELGDNFKKVGDYSQRFKGIPHILELDHLTVSGDVTFGWDVQLKGTVIVVANHGSRIDIPSGAILENKVVTGNLRILDH